METAFPLALSGDIHCLLRKRPYATKRIGVKEILRNVSSVRGYVPLMALKEPTSIFFFARSTPTYPLLIPYQCPTHLILIPYSYPALLLASSTHTVLILNAYSTDPSPSYLYEHFTSICICLSRTPHGDSLYIFALTNVRALPISLQRCDSLCTFALSYSSPTRSH